VGASCARAAELTSCSSLLFRSQGSPFSVDHTDAFQGSVFPVALIPPEQSCSNMLVPAELALHM
jgi:hypothetical protein